MLSAMTADARPADETASPRRPKRPASLVVGVVAATFGALFYAMTANAVSGLGPDSGAQLPSVALLFALLAVRFNWARITITVLLGLLTILWFPAVVAIGRPEMELFTLGMYALIAVVVSATGVALLFAPRSNAFYRGVATWRAHRKTGGAGG
jgi:putative effector of murein hydrolase LrgA (UPF0299 family)